MRETERERVKRMRETEREKGERESGANEREKKSLPTIVKNHSRRLYLNSTVVMERHRRVSCIHCLFDFLIILLFVIPLYCLN